MLLIHTFQKNRSCLPDLDRTKVSLCKLSKGKVAMLEDSSLILLVILVTGKIFGSISWQTNLDF